MEKKVVYLVYKESDDYEDYEKILIKAFFRKEKAEKFKNKLEKELKEDIEQYEKYCSKCNGIGNMSDNCHKYQAEIDDKDCINCINWFEIQHVRYVLEKVKVE